MVYDLTFNKDYPFVGSIGSAGFDTDFFGYGAISYQDSVLVFGGMSDGSSLSQIAEYNNGKWMNVRKLIISKCEDKKSIC